jgi:hypothetical protein
MNKGNSTQQYTLLFERLMAIAIAINFILILFDLSYIPLRDSYVKYLYKFFHDRYGQEVSQVNLFYDPIKGIKPHRETTKYLETVDGLEKQVSLWGLTSPKVKAQLQTLTDLSTEMVNTSPFVEAGKSGILEKIKDRMREHVHKESAKRAFATFWSQEYLSQNHWTQEIDFFDHNIRPLMLVNYYRQIGEDGLFINRFWQIDQPFVFFFGVELLGHIFYLKRKYSYLGWIEALLWRWYDLLLLLPFFRWLRIIPLMIRLDRSHLVDLKLIQQQVNQGVLANFAEELTEIVVVRVINQVQGSIQRGDVLLWLKQRQNAKPYLDINQVNELEAMIELLVLTIIQQVMPKIQPEMVAILRHAIFSACQQVPIYQNFQNLPGVVQTQAYLSEQLSEQITTSLYEILQGMSTDPVTKKLSVKLVESFSTALGGELQEKHVMTKIQSLLFDFLEEVKINYVQHLSQDDIDKIIAETRQMRTQAAVDPMEQKGGTLAKME